MIVTSLKRLAIKLISSVAIFVGTQTAIADSFVQKPNSSFELQSYDNGDQELVYVWNGKKIKYTVGGSTLKVGVDLSDLSDSQFSSLREADLYEAQLYELKSDKSYLCFDFGFGGILKSGSFQKIRGLILLRKSEKSASSIFYMRGPDINCGSVLHTANRKPN
jgi:hypothetical protein